MSGEDREQVALACLAPEKSKYQSRANRNAAHSKDKGEKIIKNYVSGNRKYRKVHLLGLSFGDNRDYQLPVYGSKQGINLYPHDEA